MKRAFLIITALMLLLLTGCAKNPGLEEDPRAFFAAWDKATQKDKVLEVAAKNYATEYPEELNLATDPGLLTMEDFTGPIVCFDNLKRTNAAIKQYTPDMPAEEYMKSNRLPVDDIKTLLYTEMSTFIKNYPEAVSDEKLTAIQQRKLPVIYMVTECTGYEDSIQYNVGPVYRRHFRNSFYRLDTGKLIAWESEPRHFKELDRMDSRNAPFDFNGKLVFSGYEEGSGVLEQVAAMLLNK